MEVVDIRAGTQWCAYQDHLEGGNFLQFACRTQHPFGAFSLHQIAQEGQRDPIGIQARANLIRVHVKSWMETFRIHYVVEPSRWGKPPCVLKATTIRLCHEYQVLAQLQANSIKHTVGKLLPDMPYHRYVSGKRGCSPGKNKAVLIQVKDIGL